MKIWESLRGGSLFCAGGELITLLRGISEPTTSLFATKHQTRERRELATSQHSISLSIGFRPSIPAPHSALLGKRDHARIPFKNTKKNHNTAERNQVLPNRAPRPGKGRRRLRRTQMESAMQCLPSRSGLTPIRVTTMQWPSYWPAASLKSSFSAYRQCTETPLQTSLSRMASGCWSFTPRTQESKSGGEQINP